MPACVDCHRYDARRRLCTVVGGSPIRKCVLAMLERECPTYRGRVLEIGCGGWDYAKRLCERAGCEWFGIDPMLVDTKGRRSVATAEGVVTRIPYPDAHFDVVLGSQTLEHWREWDSDYFEGLDEIHRVLKPGGLLSLNFPIHFHGHPMFVRGDGAAIRSIFRAGDWRITAFEPWRRDHNPLPIFRGWRTCGLADEAVAGGTSSYQVQLHAIKLDRSAPGPAPTPGGDDAIRRALAELKAARSPYFYHERLLPGQERWARQFAEHAGRYALAARGVTGRRVLDVGCGAGLGTQLLAGSGAAEVVGVDYADQALFAAAQSHPHERVTYQLGDAEVLDNVAGPFDRIVAFDVFERLNDPDRMLARCAALLAPGGDFFCSTPDTRGQPKRSDGSPENPFHVREYDADEFTAALARHFEKVELLSQHLTDRYVRLRRRRLHRPLWRRALGRIGRTLGFSPAARPQVRPPSADDWIIAPLPSTGVNVGGARVLIARCVGPKVG